MRRFLTIALLAVLLFGLPAGSALAQAFPSKMVYIMVPYPPGGATDALARALAFELNKTWGQSVVVENSGGAGSIIGTSKVARSAPDGYTLLFAISNTVLGNRFLYKTLPYDPDKSLSPVTMVVRGGMFVLATPSLHANSMHELVEAARLAPGSIAYGSVGTGSTQHLLFETIAKREGVKFLHVPYKGAPELISGLLRGDVQVAALSETVSGSMLKAAKIKALAIGGQKRSPNFPDVPTFVEAGFPYASSEQWWGVFAPGGANPELLDHINRDVMSIVKRPDFQQKYIATLGTDPVPATPAAFAAAIREDVKITAEMVKAAGIEPQ